MGRARAQSGFDGVFGSVRGHSPAVLATIVADELAALRRREIEQFLTDVDDAFGFTNGRATLVNSIVARAAQTEHGGNEDLVQSLAERAHQSVDALRELAVLVEVGDPKHWPNLTRPAVLALARYFETPKFSDGGHGDIVLRLCFEDPDWERERLRPLCLGVGAFISRQSRKEANALNGVCYEATKIMQKIALPAEELGDVLASWVRAFAYLLEHHILEDGQSRDALLTMYAQQYRVFGQPLKSFLPVAEFFR
jgi:hypothetical protein